LRVDTRLWRMTILRRRARKRNIAAYAGISIALISVIILLAFRMQDVVSEFDGQRALDDVRYQLSLGPRIPGGKAHQQTINWIQHELSQFGWEVSIQETRAMGHPIRNVIAKWGEGRPWIILGAHYDSRLISNREGNEKYQQTPTPGANDGASGVAVLMELGRLLPKYFQKTDNISGKRAEQIWLVFFDAEDNGDIHGWDWILGSQAFVSGLEMYPDSAVIVDMVGDSDLNISQEAQSDPYLINEIWKTAAKLGYSEEFTSRRRSILDDHIPFVNAGIPAVDIIDIDYPYWHTTLDTEDKVSSESLRIVGDVLLNWLFYNP